MIVADGGRLSHVGIEQHLGMRRWTWQVDGGAGLVRNLQSGAASQQQSPTVLVRRRGLVRHVEIVLLVALVDVHHAERPLVGVLREDVVLQHGQLLLQPARVRASWEKHVGQAGVWRHCCGTTLGAPGNDQATLVTRIQ